MAAQGPTLFLGHRLQTGAVELLATLEQNIKKYATKNRGEAKSKSTRKVYVFERNAVRTRRAEGLLKIVNEAEIE